MNGDLYYVYHDIPATGTNRPNIYLIQSTNSGTNWDPPRQVNVEPGGTPTDQWQPVLAVKPDGTQLFVAWYDRQNDPTNHSLIDVYGSFVTLPLGTNVSANFRISTVSFPPIFTGTNQVLGTYDPTYPEEIHETDPRHCTDFFGNYANHMGDYDTAVADDNYVFYTWSDKRTRSRAGSVARQQADIRLVRLPWPP